MGRGGREVKEREKSKPPPSSQNHPTKVNNQNFPSKQFRQTDPVRTKEVRAINFDASFKKFQV